LYARSVGHTLGPDQAARFEETLRQRAAYCFEAFVDQFVNKLSRALGMSAAQRGQFRRAVLDGTRPPRAFGRMEFYAVYYQASFIPIAHFRAFLDEAQLRTLERLFDQAGRVERLLKTSGYVPADPPAPGPETTGAKN
jgi:hypothetical protein